jgi:hypothetical protein
MMAAESDFKEVLLANLKEAQIEMDQGRKPLRGIGELRKEILSMAKENNTELSIIDEAFKEFEEWRSKPLRKWRVVVKDIGHTEVGIIKARTKEEVITGIECIGIKCAPIENVEVTEIDTGSEEP